MDPLRITSPAGTALAGALDRLASGDDLDAATADAAFRALISGNESDDDIAIFLARLRDKGESATEVAAGVRVLRATMRPVSHPHPERLVDTCGTGGGRVTTINVSTAAAFVVAGAGVPVAKHGNRSFSSRSGSADVLEALGVALDHGPDAAEVLLDRHGIVFLFAPAHHPAMRHVAAARRQLGGTTIMNLLGPLSNPAGARRQVVGVSDLHRGPLVAEALLELDTLHALVVHAELGLDEISPCGPTSVWEVRDGAIRTWTVDPRAHHLASDSLAGLEGGEPTENARRLEALLDAPRAAAPALRNAVLLNAAAGIYVSGTVSRFDEAVARAIDALDRGAARARLDALRRRDVSTSG